MTLFTPQCPGCRYDLSGEVTRWDTQCPLQGTCPECGLEFGWRSAIVPPRVRWAFDLPDVHGVALKRWWATSLRTLRPSAFWRGLADEPLATPRAVLWFILLVVQLHLLSLGTVLIQRGVNVHRWSRSGGPHPFWQSTGVTLEMLLSPYYDQGELTAAGLTEPMYFLDRIRIALACGSLAAGACLAAFGAIAGFGVNRASLWRAVVYGLMPIAFMYVYNASYIAIVLVLQDVIHTPMKWWYGTYTATGFNPGGAAWLARFVNLACIIWLAVWWWHGASCSVSNRHNMARAVAVSAALITAGLLILQYLVHWGRLGTL